MTTFEQAGLAIEQAPAKTINLDNAIELSVATYNILNLITDEGKAREAFGEEIQSLTDALPESVTSKPYDIVIVPKLGALSLSSLIDRYDSLTTQKGNPETHIWSGLWNQYSSDELNQGQTTDLQAQAVLLQVHNDYNEPGLYITGQDLKSQRITLTNEQALHAEENPKTQLHSLSPAGYLIRNAMQLERGEPLPDQETFTRFIELENKSVDGGSYVPGACFSGGRVRLGGSGGRASSRDGVRLSVGQA